MNLRVILASVSATMIAFPASSAVVINADLSGNNLVFSYSGKVYVRRPGNLPLSVRKTFPENGSREGHRRPTVNSHIVTYYVRTVWKSLTLAYLQALVFPAATLFLRREKDVAKDRARRGKGLFFFTGDHFLLLRGIASLRWLSTRPVVFFADGE